MGVGSTRKDRAGEAIEVEAIEEVWNEGRRRTGSRLWGLSRRDYNIIEVDAQVDSTRMK